jgi:predicted nucleic acid-binding protein
MAMMVASALFVDTNILVFATNPASPWHELATEALNQARGAGIDLVISAQIVREYLAAATRPDTTGRLAPLDDVLANVQIFRAEFRLVPDSPVVLDRLTELMHRVPVGGRQVHDANIVATMLTYGIPQLLTHNVADFARYADVITVRPLVGS